MAHGDDTAHEFEMNTDRAREVTMKVECDLRIAEREL